MFHRSFSDKILGSAYFRTHIKIKRSDKRLGHGSPYLVSERHICILESHLFQRGHISIRHKSTDPFFVTVS